MPINGSEAIVLLIVALVLLGPERLPQYAEQLARLVRELKKLATGAQDRFREELGPEFRDFDLSTLDPRQYDPRRIVREALADTPPARRAGPIPGEGAANTTATGAPVASPIGDPAPEETGIPAMYRPGGQGELSDEAPYDDEAT